MAQVSSNLMAYDQIFLKIRDFMILEKTTGAAGKKGDHP